MTSTTERVFVPVRSAAASMPASRTGKHVTAGASVTGCPAQNGGSEVQLEHCKRPGNRPGPLPHRDGC